jgi:hypothetical protein
VIDSRSRASAGRLRRTVIWAVLLAMLAASSLSACDDSGSDSAAASPSPSPVPSPLITGGAPPAGAVAAVREFWTLVGKGRLAEAKRLLVAPGSPIRQWSGDDIGSARFLRVVPSSVGQWPAEGATIEFCVDVWIEPAQAGPNVWGDAREHQLFEHVVRMSDGTWRMWDSGTGP